MIKKLYKDTNGQGMVEYGLIIALIALVVIGAIVALGGGLGNSFNRTTGALNNAGNP